MVSLKKPRLLSEIFEYSIFSNFKNKIGSVFIDFSKIIGCVNNPSYDVRSFSKSRPLESLRENFEKIIMVLKRDISHYVALSVQVWKYFVPRDCKYM